MDRSRKTLFPGIKHLVCLLPVAVALLIPFGGYAVAADNGELSTNMGAPLPTQTQIDDLKKQISALQQELEKLKASGNSTASQTVMQSNWQEMQKYMAQFHRHWGRGATWMTGPNGMRGCPMLGEPGSMWPAPKNVSVKQYRQQMLQHMQQMQEQLNQIAQTTDPQKKEQLMEQHWRDMYKNMQDMRGMGWMWGNGNGRGPGMMNGGMMNGGMMHHGMMNGGGMGWGMMSWGDPESAKSLPKEDSAGAKLVGTYCTQCHAAPKPTLHTAKEWSEVAERMQTHMTAYGSAIKTPSEGELKAIISYMREHARQP